MKKKILKGITLRKDKRKGKKKEKKRYSHRIK
jgi:hypothetical protein